MERDPVCGMIVGDLEDSPRSAHKGNIIYFCCPICKKMFDENPDSYIAGIHYEYNHSKPKPDKCKLIGINALCNKNTTKQK